MICLANLALLGSKYSWHQDVRDFHSADDSTSIRDVNRVGIPYLEGMHFKLHSRFPFVENKVWRVRDWWPSAFPYRSIGFLKFRPSGSMFLSVRFGIIDA